jgi:hypothetical protein
MTAMNNPALFSIALVAVNLVAHADTSLPKKNWFGDPFFQVASGVSACPVPEGPMLTYDEQRAEAHWRAERGTSCWLAGKCKDSNAFRYDQALAAPVAAALRALPWIDTSSVWVTIQRRWVFLEGCVSSSEQALQLEQAAKAVAEVEVVVPAMITGTPKQADKPPYAVAPKNR